MVQVNSTFEHKGKTYQVETAVCVRADLSTEPYGYLTSSLMFEYNGGGGQGVGPLALTSGKIPDAFAGYFIAEVLGVFGTMSWDSIKGRTCYVLREGGFGSEIKGIAGRYTEDVIIFSDMVEDMDKTLGEGDTRG